MADRSIRPAIGLAALLMCASGCGPMLVQAPGTAAACTWVNQQATAQPGAASSDTVVLLDDSASFWPAQGKSDLLPDGPAQIATAQLLNDFESAGTRLVSFGTFDGSSATVDWKLSNAALPVPYGDGHAIQGQYQATASCLNTVVASAGSTTPQASGTDVIGALTAAGQQLQGAAASRSHVVLITDGLSNTGCLNLNQVLSQGLAAATVVDACPDHTDLATLRGVGLTLYGVGFRAVGPPLTSAEQAWVENYWRDLCGALGVASPSSCVAPAGKDVVRTSEVSRPADPAIVFPAVPPGARRLTVPADLLFAFDSSAISPAGQSYLGLLVQQIKAQGRTITQVIGHTDEVGTRPYNLGLSQRRAQAVQSFLAAEGFSGVTATGMGESDPACSPEYTSAGAPIQSCMAKDRRVQIILGG